MRQAHLLPASRLAVLALALLAGSAGAQQIFRIVGPDGRVTFSDKPPADANAKVEPARTAAPPADRGNATLPAQLRQVASRFPVVLYAGAECAPCNSGRSFLVARGIPFAERTVGTAEDVAALQRLSGATTLPFMTIGGQQLRGFSEVEWTQFLDAAGYPQVSQLPPGYRQPAATPLVVAQEPARPAPGAAAAPDAASAAPPRAPATDGSNPAGIQF